MKTYKVHALLTVSCWTEVEAPSEEVALKLAYRRAVAECHIDGTCPVDECWHFDTDGEPHNLRVEEE